MCENVCNSKPLRVLQNVAGVNLSVLECRTMQWNRRSRTNLQAARGVATIAFSVREEVRDILDSVRLVGETQE